MLKATDELIAKKPPKTLVFIIEGVTVALAITVTAAFFFEQHVILAISKPISMHLLVGSFMYGVGASINNACAFGTLNSLLRGNMNFLGTLFGMALGVFVFIYSGITLDNSRAYNTNLLIGDYKLFLFIPILLALWGFIGWKAKKVFAQESTSLRKRWLNYLKSPLARDFISVSMLGIAGGSLFLLLGTSWDYTRWITSFQHITMGVEKLEHQFYILSVSVIAVVSGVLFATFLSNDFKRRLVDFKDLILKIFGGFLMGFAASIIPGGNDRLILYDLVGLNFHAFAALSIMMTAIAFSLIVKSKMRLYF